MVNFHFSPETPDEDYIANLQVVNNLPAAAFEGVVRLGFEHLAAERTERLSDSILALGKEHGIKASILHATVEAFLIFLNGSTKYNLTGDQLKEDLVELGVEEKRIGAIQGLWNAKVDDLYDVAVAQSLKVNELVDMEWSFGVAASCKEVKKLGSAFLRVKLVLNRGGKIQTVFMEMTLPQFYEFIHEMEKAQASLASKSQQ
eukprot:CAMPEP_0201490606 /NCGR_PEP_ID=MMETSP0151_2-20130828/26668_1 /ASSEMBLY_ACC=CAM_ASM_000257 /TAXON_ID=200890 /ORGANISM="Paramoeba atlantica, Strain 621/1 / CCAP 1560/9" /LENGTH=201 /DNA_ID=CAMNT_0047876609 /DNA_START=37 /DNA_END=642 /DNA_ORIENTATION=-